MRPIGAEAEAEKSSEDGVTGGMSFVTAIMVPGGVEPPTLRLLAVRSNQLSYET